MALIKYNQANGLRKPAKCILLQKQMARQCLQGRYTNNLPNVYGMKVNKR